MKYKIGDVARMLGVSADILRYYEKKGVVTPEKDKNNDYRYYSSWDINFLLDCLWFKNFGFSIEQIADMVRIPDLGELSSLFLDKESELRATITRCQLLLKRSEEHRRDLAKIKTLLYRCEIDEQPEMVRYINRVGTTYSKNSGFEALAQRWLGALPFNSRYFEIDPQYDSGYSWGFSMTSEYADALNFDVSEPMVVIPKRKCIHTVFNNPGGKGSFCPALLQYALTYAKEHDLTVTGPISGILLASVVEEGQLTGYFEAWIPIES